MNICFLMGKIISEINFKFMIQGKNKYIAIFQIEVENKTIITVKGYDEIADYCYNQLQKDNYIIIMGILDYKGEIEITEIEQFTLK